MKAVELSLLRGICQMPGYVAAARGFFRDQGLNVRIAIEPTAALVPERLLRGAVQFAVMPWTRVAAASVRGEPLVLVCGSGCEEAAIVVRHGIGSQDVKKVAVPQRGGIKDLTAQGLMEDLGWGAAECLRMPSGDGAILALVGQGADAASMVEPYATLLQDLRLGTVVRRTGDLWPGAPGCSLTTTRQLIEGDPDLVQRVVTAFVRAARFVEEEPDEAAAIAADYIGVGARFIRAALRHCRPNIHALNNERAMGAVLALMLRLGYLEQRPARPFYDASFLERAVRPAAVTGVVSRA